MPSIRCRTAEDADAYLARLESYARQPRRRAGAAAGGRRAGLIAPAFLLDKAIGQIGISLASARAGGGLVESLVRRTKDIPGTWGPRAEAIARDKVAPALARQLAELQAQRARATMDAGMWARPRGDEYYQWALRASTTTRMTPDEVHQLGQQQITELQAQMDGILKGLGYTKGTVGARMTGLGDDPRFQFPDNDAGRAEILDVHPGAAGDDPRQAPRGVRHPGQGQPRGQAPAARGRARRARRLRRRRIDRRVDSRQVLDQPAHDQAPQPLQPADAHAPRGDPGPRLAGGLLEPVAARPDAAGVQRLFGRLGALRRTARR